MFHHTTVPEAMGGRDQVGLSVRRVDPDSSKGEGVSESRHGILGSPEKVRYNETDTISTSVRQTRLVLGLPLLTTSRTWRSSVKFLVLQVMVSTVLIVQVWWEKTS